MVAVIYHLWSINDCVCTVSIKLFLFGLKKKSPLIDTIYQNLPWELMKSPLIGRNWGQNAYKTLLVQKTSCPLYLSVLDHFLDTLSIALHFKMHPLSPESFFKILYVHGIKSHVWKCSKVLGDVSKVGNMTTFHVTWKKRLGKINFLNRNLRADKL